jgi:hypothetical protein
LNSRLYTTFIGLIYMQWILSKTIDIVCDAPNFAALLFFCSSQCLFAVDLS